MVDTVAYSAMGLGYGTLLSIFFIKKRKILGFSTGFGAGLAVHKNFNSQLNHWF
jgi:hypothetical protein